MKGYIDIENSKTQRVETLCVDIIKYKDDDEIIFDISNLNDHELKILKDAVNDKLTYTDIEMFFINNSNIPNFGPDYHCKIYKNTLILNYIPKVIKNDIEEKNEDWTLNYEEEFNKLAFEFIKSDSQYLLIYKEGNNLKAGLLKINLKSQFLWICFLIKILI